MVYKPKSLLITPLYLQTQIENTHLEVFESPNQHTFFQHSFGNYDDQDQVHVPFYLKNSKGIVFISLSAGMV